MMALSSSPKRSDVVDGLRGLAALAVFVNHVGMAPIGGVCAPKWMLWAADGPAAVMIFFILSGYVIGLTNAHSTVEKDIKSYSLRRLVRLMPINFIAVLLACIVSTQVDLRTVLGNLFFLGNYTPYAGISMPVIEGNVNLWSLNYEIVFYAFFILIWKLNPSLKFVMGASLAVAWIGWYTKLIPLFVACYAAGFWFWGSGLILAWKTEPNACENSNWPSCILLLLVTWKLRGLLNLLAGFPIPLFDGPVARVYYLDFLPVCIWLISIVAQRTIPHLKWLKAFCALIPIVGLVIKWDHPGYFTPLEYRMAMGSYLLALLLWQWRPSLRFFRIFQPIGAIAFALYAISCPIQNFIFARVQWLPANYFGFSMGVLITSIVCFAASWYLERRIQPHLSQLLIRRSKPQL